MPGARHLLSWPCLCGMRQAAGRWPGEPWAGPGEQGHAVTRDPRVGVDGADAAAGPLQAQPTLALAQHTPPARVSGRPRPLGPAAVLSPSTWPEVGELGAAGGACAALAGVQDVGLSQREAGAKLNPGCVSVWAALEEGRPWQRSAAGCPWSPPRPPRDPMGGTAGLSPAPCVWTQMDPDGHRGQGALPG